MAVYPGFQEKHPNFLIWILFGFSFLFFLVSAILYSISIKRIVVEEDPLFDYWPLFDALFRVLPHILVCTIYKLCRFISNKSVILTLHIILAVLAFIGTVFANEHMIYKGETFNVTSFMETAIRHKHIPKDPLIWTFTSWLEFFYVSFVCLIS